MSTKRIAVIGAGGMARVRTKALRATGRAVICGVASRTQSSAKTFGDEIGCAAVCTNYDDLLGTSPEAVLVELPHAAQDEAVLWALQHGLHVHIGGCLASSLSVAEEIRTLAASEGLVVEAGYEARYSAVWEAGKRLVTDGSLGRPVAVRSIALWAGDPASWYYNQEVSGGMPLTHMTYCFLNPVRWILGDPRCVSALTNAIKHTGGGRIEEESCVANLQFDQDVIGTMTASFICPGKVPGWSVLFLGTEGVTELFPEENRLVIYRDGQTERQEFSASGDAFEIQAAAFLATIDGRGECRNTPADTVGDIRAAEAITASARRKETVWLEEA